MDKSGDSAAVATDAAASASASAKTAPATSDQPCEGAPSDVAATSAASEAAKLDDATPQSSRDCAPAEKTKTRRASRRRESAVTEPSAGEECDQYATRNNEISLTVDEDVSAEKSTELNKRFRRDPCATRVNEISLTDDEDSSAGQISEAGKLTCYDEHAGRIVNDSIKGSFNSSYAESATVCCVDSVKVIPSTFKQEYVQCIAPLPPEDCQVLKPSEGDCWPTTHFGSVPRCDIELAKKLTASEFNYSDKDICKEMVKPSDIISALKSCFLSSTFFAESIEPASVLIYALRSSDLASEQDFERNRTVLPTEESDAVMRSETERLPTYGSGLRPFRDVSSPEELASAGFPYSGAQGSGSSATRFGEPQPSVSAGRSVHRLISLPEPEHPWYAVEARRLASFSRWPLWASQSPENLAKAGFYYTGAFDNVQCFHCDGGLRNWQIIDNPWEEHARSFKMCQYLLNVKGQAYVDEVQKKYAVGYESARMAVTHAAATSRTSPGTILEHPSVQLVKCLGFNNNQILAALERFYPQHCTGVMPKGAELLDAVFKMDAEASGAHPALNAADRSLPTSGIVSTSEAESYPFAVAESRPSETASVPSPFVRQRLEPVGRSGPRASVFVNRAALDVKKQPELPPAVRSLTLFRDTAQETRAHCLEENKKLREHLECKCCRQRPIEVVLLPCGHFCACLECVASLSNCPVCAFVVRGVIRTYLC